MEKLINVPSNDMLRKEQNKFMRTPVHVLVISNLSFKVLRTL